MALNLSSPVRYLSSGSNTGFGSIILQCYVYPNASRQSLSVIGSASGSTVRVYLSVAAKDNKANVALIELMSKVSHPFLQFSCSLGLSVSKDRLSCLDHMCLWANWHIHERLFIGQRQISVSYMEINQGKKHCRSQELMPREMKMVRSRCSWNDWEMLHQLFHVRNDSHWSLRSPEYQEHR